MNFIEVRWLRCFCGAWLRYLSGKNNSWCLRYPGVWHAEYDTWLAHRSLRAFNLLRNGRRKAYQRWSCGGLAALAPVEVLVSILRAPRFQTIVEMLKPLNAVSGEPDVVLRIHPHFAYTDRRGMGSENTRHTRQVRTLGFRFRDASDVDGSTGKHLKVVLSNQETVFQHTQSLLDR